MDEEVDMDSKAKLSRIDLVFENCEYCTIPANEIKLLLLNEFNQSINYTEWNGLHKFRSCSLESLQIYKKYLLQNYPYMGNDEHINEQYTLFNRIHNYNDIVSIDIYWIVNNIEYVKKYYLPWNDEDEYTNKYQKVVVNDEENIDESFIDISIKVEKEENEKC